jgi:hypothetical protein
VTLHAVAHVIARILFGETWFERGDGFEVYSSMVARASPLGRRAEGSWCCGILWTDWAKTTPTP